MNVIKPWVGISLACLATLFCHAGTADRVFPGTRYDASIPDLKSVTGYDFGERIAMHHEALAYVKSLAAASPKVSLEIREKTWQGREMVLIMITSAENQQRLDAIRQNYQAIADPRKTDESAMTSLIEDLPVAVWLQESVHGNEISGADSGLLLAWHLAAAQGSSEVERFLAQSVVMIEMMQNPDGRDRFIFNARQTRSPLGADADPAAAERDEPWPSGRFNHYLFDMNRDWFAMSQPETRAKVATFLKWFPQVTVDLHEMGSEATFFAAKPAPPANPLLSKEMIDQYEAFGKAIGRAFDQRGIPYFHSEIFDSFYPGYGEAWPSLQGAMGVLFEQGSARGLKYQRRNGNLHTHVDAVLNQALASYAVLRHAVDNRAAVLRFFYNNRKAAIEKVKGIRQVFLLPGDDPSRTIALGRLLQRQGIEVEQIGEKIRSIQGKPGSVDVAERKVDIPSGALLVRFNQPAGILAKTLLVDRIDMDADFVNRQKVRRKQRKPTEIYDLTAWSLPLLYGVDPVYVDGNGWRGNGSSDLNLSFQSRNMDANLGFLIPYDGSTGPLLADLLREGIRVSFSTKPIRFNNMDFPRGTLLITRKDNPDDLATRLSRISAKYEKTVVGTNTSWFDEGPGFGSGQVRFIRPPKIALLWDSPTNPMSAGWMRYVLEQRLNYPVTLLKTRGFGRARMDHFDVLLMPEGYGWGAHLSGSLDKIKAWVRGGGVLVAVGESVSWLANEKTGLLSTAREQLGGSVPKQPPKGEPEKLEPDPAKMILPRSERPDSAYGAFLRTKFDEEHWLAFGMKTEQAVLVDSNRIFRPIRLDKGVNVGRFAQKATVLMSGYALPETVNQFANKPFAMVQRHGRGMVIAFTEDPNYRAFTHGLLPLMANAVFFGSAMSGR